VTGVILINDNETIVTLLMNDEVIDVLLVALTETDGVIASVVDINVPVDDNEVTLGVDKLLNSTILLFTDELVGCTVGDTMAAVLIKLMLVVIVDRIDCSVVVGDIISVTLVAVTIVETCSLVANNDTVDDMNMTLELTAILNCELIDDILDKVKPSGDVTMILVEMELVEDDKLSTDDSIITNIEDSIVTVEAGEIRSKQLVNFTSSINSNTPLRSDVILKIS